MAAPLETPKKNLVLREFGGVNTQAARQVIGDNEFAWLEDLIPIGNGNLKVVPGAALAPIATITGKTVYYMKSAVLSAQTLMFMFCTDGSAYQVDLVTGIVTNFAPAATFFGSGTRLAVWKNERILICDPAKGYFDWDRVTLTSYAGTIGSVTILAGGTGFTAAPGITPSTGNATFTSTIGCDLATLSAAGASYSVGDILTVAGGTLSPANLSTNTPVGNPAQITVTAVSAGTITGINLTLAGSYITAPANPASVTGGHGSGATFTLDFTITSVSVVNRGTPNTYLVAPNLLINGSSETITTSGNYTATPANPVATTTNGSGTGKTLNVVYGVAAFNATNGSGSGYQIGDIVTAVGGTFTTAATFRISSIYFGGGSSVNTLNYSLILVNSGNYTVSPGSTISVTGGHGTGMQISAVAIGAVSSTDATLGSGYVAGNTVTVVGGTFTTAAVLTVAPSGGAGVNSNLVANLASSSNGTGIVTYAGRVWLTNAGRTVLFTAPNSYQDFSTGNGGGLFTITDESLKSNINGFLSANNYLYIFGASSVHMLSSVRMQLGITTFSLDAVSTSFGTDIPDGIGSYQRSIVFASDYGFYSLYGVTPQKISDPLDGMFNAIDLTKAVSFGQVVIFGQYCNCWLVQYVDPTTNISRPLILVFFNGKWFFSTQIPNATFLASALINDSPALYGTDGTNLYQLFVNSASDKAHNFKSKLWDMKDPLITKQLLKMGVESKTSSNNTTINFTVDTETTNNTLTWPIIGIGYNFLKRNVDTEGNYLGLTLNGSSSNTTYIGFYLQYELRTPWKNLPN